jgi:uncharacterized protein (TIGR03546 family)
MPGLEFFVKLLKVLHSDTSPNQISAGFVFGMILGLTPLFNLHNLVVVILLLILNVNIAMSILAFGIFSGFAYIFDSLFHDIGYYFLVELKNLKDFWTSVYDVPILSLTNFNNTVVFGSLFTSLVLFIPIFYLTKFIVVNYRSFLLEKFRKWKIVQLIKSSRWYQYYEKFGE